MSKTIKEQMTSEFKTLYDDIGNACVVSLIGLDGVSTNLLRGRLREKNLEVHIIQNRIARRALQGTLLAPLADTFKGPCALVTGQGSATEIAKELAECAKVYEAIELKSGILEGEPDIYTVEALSKMKGRKELLGDVAMLICSPGRALAGAIQSPGGKIAGVLKALADRDAA
jgi:large subunit ribosomal protein L10